MMRDAALATMDMEKLRARFDDDEELLEEIFQVFIKEAPERRAGMETALADGDLDRLVRLAHALKGVAGTLFAEALRQSSQTLERTARAGETAELAPLVRTVLTELERTVEDLKSAL